MPVYVAWLLTFGVAAGITALLVSPVIRLSHQYGWLVYPGPRRRHPVPTPVVGGLAISVGWLAALLLTFALEYLAPALHRSPYEDLRLGLLIAGALIVAAISFADDLRELPAGPRLAVHFVAALVAVGPYLWDHTLYRDAQGQYTEARGIILTAFNFPFVNQVHLHDVAPWLAIAATLVWIVGLQNMLNWVDGMDGLATGITLIAALVLAVHALNLGQWTVALLPLALAGACAGFLPFNLPPARIFMGDVGAMTLGYVLAVSAIIGGAKLATALLVLAVPIIDMVWLVATRLVQGHSAASAGRDHLHHRLLDLGFAPQHILAFYYTLSGVFGTVALLDVMTPMMKLFTLLVVAAAVLLMLMYLSAVQKRVS